LQFNVLTGGGRMGAAMRAYDWASSPLGVPNDWPSSLKTLVGVLLGAEQPMFIGWGNDHILIYNDGYAPMLADRHPNAFGRPFFDVWPEVRDELTPLFDAVRRGEPVHMADLALELDRPGRPREAHFAFGYTPVRSDAGDVVGLFCACTETTDKVLADRVTSAARDRLFEMTRDLFGVATFDGYLKTINPAWASVLNRSHEELTSRPFSEIIHPDDLAVTGAVVEALMRGEPAHQFHVRLLQSDGTPLAFAWSAVPDVAAGIFYTTGRDITDDQKREEMLRQSQKMESMGQLTGGVAHDFNNLLTPIIGSLDMLMRRGVGSERERRLIDGALQSAERAKTLVQRLLAFARRQPLQPIAVDIADLVKSMARLIDSTLGPQIDVRVDIAADLPPAVADPNQLEMALLNLAVNARDAMPGGGRLTIAATRESVLGQHATGLAQGRYVRLSVSDTGIGMDAATRMHAIEPFFSTKGVGKGTGLGLSMVHGLTAQLGGRLMIESALGNGTTIGMWLPVSMLPVATGEETSPRSDMRQGHSTALLIDDEDLVRMTTADMLADLGFDVIEAMSAEEGLRLIEEGIAPDVVVTDHLMPGMTGADLVRLLRNTRPDLPVLVVSGYAEAEGIPPDTARLTKPFRNADLAASLSALLPALHADQVHPVVSKMPGDRS
jgi:PAS domain S-box-containing protein